MHGLRHLLRTRLTYANVMATVAVFVALGGSSYAALRIGSGAIVDNSIRSSDIRNNQLRSIDVHDQALLAKDFKAGQLPQGPKGDKGDKGDPGQAGIPPTSYYTSRRPQTNLPPASGELTITSLTSLPAGSYILTAHTVAVNFGPPGYVRCGIKAAGKNSAGAGNFPASATAVGNGPPPGGQVWSPVGQIFISLPVSSSAPFTAELSCYQTVSNTAYLEETRLMASPVGATDVRGDP
jgi:hypothetical protein